MLMNIQRLGSDAQFDDNYVNTIIGFRKKYPKSVSEVWLATSYGFPSVEAHRTKARKLGEIAKRFRSAGIAVSLQLSNSIGHGQYMSSCDCTGLVYDGSPVQKLIGHDGKKAEYCFCWRGEHLKKYLHDELTAYAEAIQPDCIWVDDDFRADNHNPVSYGCFCPDCMKKFNDRYHTSFTREELVNEILHGDLSVRRNFTDFLREGLGSLMEEICKTVIAVSPDSAFGLQSAFHGYAGSDSDYLFEPMYRITGKAPRYRGGGGYYNDHIPADMFGKANELAFQNSRLPDYIGDIVPEIENLPFTAFGKSPAGTALESIAYLASGHTGLSYSMMMRFTEEPSFYERFYRLFDRMNPYFERLSDLSKRSVGGGLRYATAKDDYLKPLSPSDTLSAEGHITLSDAALLRRDAVPVTFDITADDTVLLTTDTAKAMTDTELSALMGGSVVMTGGTAAYLVTRGFDLGLSPKPLDENTVLKLFEVYTDNELNQGGYLPKFAASWFVPGGRDVYTFGTIPENADVLGIYDISAGLDPIYTDNAPVCHGKPLPYGYPTALVHTKEGGKIAVFGYRLFAGIVPSTQRDRILRIADAVGKMPLPAVMRSADQYILYPRIDRQSKKTLGVTFINVTVGEEEPVVSVRNPAGTKFVYMTSGGRNMTVTPESVNGEYIFTLPSLAPFEAGTIFCESF